MKVFVAGASGALGSRLVPMLVADGHDVVAMTRSPGKVERLRALGAEPVVADGLDREAVTQAVVRAEPRAVIHQMTALAGMGNLRRFDDEFAVTNRLRTVGTDSLLEAARRAGAGRFIAQSYAGWPYERSGGPVKSEDDPLDPAPPAAMSRTLAAIRHLEATVTGAGDVEGIVLRYGAFYGPGSILGEGGSLLEQVRKRRLPVVGDGAGVWSFAHLDDAAAATVLALDRGAPGIYNVADDEPAPARVWLPDLAAATGAKPPRHVPVWLGRIAVGEPGVSLFTQIRGASNAKARRELGWELAYPTWREGFRRGLASRASAPRSSGSSWAAPCG